MPLIKPQIALVTCAAGDLAGLDPVDATTYHFGVQSGHDPFTSSGLFLPSMPYAGRVRAAYGSVAVVGTLGSAQNATFSVRNNTAATTEQISAAVPFTSAANPFSNAALTLAFAQGDQVGIQFLTPTWTTNPTVTFYAVTLLVEFF